MFDFDLLIRMPYSVHSFESCLGCCGDMDGFHKGGCSIHLEFHRSDLQLLALWEGELAWANFAQPRLGFSYCLVILTAVKKYPDPTLVIFLLQRNWTAKALVFYNPGNFGEERLLRQDWTVCLWLSFGRINIRKGKTGLAIVSNPHSHRSLHCFRWECELFF